MDAILSGEATAGERINESLVARRLGVSQTPVREALGGLAELGFLTSRPRRGFFVRALSRREAEDIYSLLADLEALALTRSAAPTSADLERLGEINRELAGASDDPLRAIELDTAFHEKLHARCPNRLLRDLLGRHRRLAFRYEVAYMRGTGRISVSSRQHERILAALARGELAAAGEAVRENWLAGIEPLADWLDWTAEGQTDAP